MRHPPKRRRFASPGLDYAATAVQGYGARTAVAAMRVRCFVFRTNRTRRTETNGTVIVDEELINRKVARRRLLRRAGTVAAGVAGAGAVGVAMASPASAGVGDELLIGVPNDGVGNPTTLTNSGQATPTLVLGNGATTGSVPNQVAGPALRLTPKGNFIDGPDGSVGMTTDGTLWTRRPGSGGTVSDFVRTGRNSTVVESISPIRMLDTRPEETAGKAGIMNPSAIDAAGFIKAGNTLNLNLDALLVFGWSIFANITVVAGGSSGFITAFPGGEPRPNASNVNYTPGLVIANFALIGLGSTGGAINVISIYAATPAKVIVDVAGAVVNFSSDVKPFAGFSSMQATASKVRERPAHLNGP